MTITTDMVKTLRERTGVGMALCKRALEEAGGDLETAVTNLRKKGMATAAKKSDRESKEGLIACAESDACVAIVEVNSETDFVAKNERFLAFLKDIAEEVAKTQPASVEVLMQQKFSKDESMTIEEYRATQIQAIGENIQIRRLQVYPKSSNKSVGLYSHLGGKIVVVVELDGASGHEEVARSVALHIAAASPQYVSPEKVPAETINNEKEIARSQLAGKPEHIMDKILDGKMQAFYDDNCLTRQAYIRDDSVSIEQFVANADKSLKVENFARWAIGE